MIYGLLLFVCALSRPVTRRLASCLVWSGKTAASRPRSVQAARPRRQMGNCLGGDGSGRVIDDLWRRVRCSRSGVIGQSQPTACVIARWCPDRPERDYREANEPHSDRHQHATLAIICPCKSSVVPAWSVKKPSYSSHVRLPSDQETRSIFTRGKAGATTQPSCSCRGFPPGGAS